MLRSKHLPTPGTQTLSQPPTRTAAETPAERQARQLETCKRLAELGLQLAHAATKKALEQMAIPENPEAPTPANPTRAAHLFATLARNIRQIILLENRIAAETPAAASQPRQNTPKPLTPPSAIHRPNVPIDEHLFATVCKELKLETGAPERWPKEARKQSFFEKKDQKTFAA